MEMGQGGKPKTVQIVRRDAANAGIVFIRVTIKKHGTLPLLHEGFSRFFLSTQPVAALIYQRTLRLQLSGGRKSAYASA